MRSTFSWIKVLQAFYKMIISQKFHLFNSDGKFLRQNFHLSARCGVVVIDVHFFRVAEDVDPYGVRVTISQRGNIQFLSVGADSISARGVSGAYGMLPYGVG